MKAKEFVIEYKKDRKAPKYSLKPRSPVAHAAQSVISGSGPHKDKKRAEKQGDVKHKKSSMPMETALRDKEDYNEKRKALDDLGRNKDVDQKAVQQRRLDLDKEAKQKGVAEDSIDQRIAYAKKNNPLQASVRQHEYGYTALVTDANTGKTSWFGGAVWQTPELAMGHAKAFVKGFPYLEQRFAQRFVDKNRDGIADQGVAEGGEYNKFKVGQRAKFKASNGKEYGVIITAVDYDDDAVKFRSAENKPFPDGELEQEVDPGWKFLTPEPRVDPNSIIAVSPNMRKTTERVRDPEDWDEGNTEPPNNFAVYINGKKWKVFQGRGQYADDQREKAHYQQLKAWAQQKSAQSGKKWEVYITGEAPT
jgi:hypothetical protein